MLKETLKKKKEPAFIHPGHFILLPMITSCALSSLGLVAGSFAFCGPAMGIKGAESQSVRTRESLGQRCRSEEGLPRAGCILGGARGE